MPERRAEGFVPKVLGISEVVGGSVLISMAAGVAFKGEELARFSPLGVRLGRFIDNFMGSRLE